MAAEPHPAVRAVHDAARAVVQHPQAPISFMRRLFLEQGRSLYDDVHHFGAVLHNLLDVPPTKLSDGDIAAIGTAVDQVVARAEQAIERNDRSIGEPLEALAQAIYLIRAQYEQIYRRGATRDA